MLPRLTLPPSPAALAAVVAAFVLPGLASHDLWKTQDAIGLGIVHGMAVSGDIIVPRIAGMPWLHDQPLYHWFALAMGLTAGKLLGYFIEFHAAARLASGAFVAAAFALLYAAARDWSGGETRRTTACGALLILLGSIGLLVHAHEALPELASLTAMCGALAALPYATSRPARAGLAFGVALGLASLSATWIAPLALGGAVVAAHLVCPEWRTRAALRFLGIALAASVLLALLWPLALALRAPDAFAEWWRISSRPHENVGQNFRHFFSTASWFTWPAWPLALWSAWSLRRRWREPRLFVPAAAVLAIVLLLIVWGPPDDENLIPLLGPLALLAAYGIFTLRRGAFAALDWFGALTFAVFAGLVWLGYIAMLTGVPAPVARNFARIAPGYMLALRPLAVGLALVLLAGWLYLIFFTRSSPLRSVARWAAGVVLLWGSFALLWMPWVDYQKSYRSVALELKGKLPARAGCIAERSLGVSQAAALDYHGGIRAQPFNPARPAACPLLLVQGTPQQERDTPAPPAGARWVKLTEVNRPGDRAERYRLYRLQK